MVFSWDDRVIVQDQDPQRERSITWRSLERIPNDTRFDTGRGIAFAFSRGIAAFRLPAGAEREREKGREYSESLNRWPSRRNLQRTRFRGMENCHRGEAWGHARGIL